MVVVIVLCLVPTAPASAHAERSASTPDDGERLEAPPTTLDIRFTEPPIGDANFEVLDGCQRDVVEDLEVQGTEITATLAQGQPGGWSVRTHVVSGIDGHATKDRWRFQVAGRPDCEAEQEPRPGAASGESEDEGGTLLLLVFAAVTLGVIGLALVLRRTGSGGA